MNTKQIISQILLNIKIWVLKWVNKFFEWVEKKLHNLIDKISEKQLILDIKKLNGVKGYVNKEKEKENT